MRAADVGRLLVVIPRVPAQTKLPREPLAADVAQVVLLRVLENLVLVEFLLVWVGL